MLPSFQRTKGLETSSNRSSFAIAENKEVPPSFLGEELSPKNHVTKNRLLDHDHGNGCMLSTSQRTKGLERSSTL
jgi:hypothetical protein